MLTTPEIHWIAGFLEGEGCFYFSRSICIASNQVQKWPMERLHSWFGGSLLLNDRFSKDRPNDRPKWQWKISGKQAAGLAMTIYPLMSPGRQEQIRKALAPWKAQRTRREVLAEERAKRSALITHCPQGHPYVGDNIKWNAARTFRSCRTCHRENNRRYNVTTRRITYAKKRAKQLKLL
jgi:hypothetical protein